ncbi:MAG: thioredoxin domain-containing protein [Gammaproteobacteria bacterium]
MQHLRLVCLLGILISGIGTALASNQLSGQPSPYLALHGDDPVDWQTWRDEVFTRAKADNRLILVSIGYFSCHWCHVMQQESYQDQTVADMLNRGYVAVKVDRELDPDLDQRLIDFVEKVRGSAGWPLNVFLTPDGYPVTGFTYLPRDSFVDVLQQLDGEWRKNHDKISAAAQEFFLTQMQDFENQAFDAPDIPAQKLMDAFVSQAMLAADELQGGFGNTSKFPNVPQLDTLINIIRRYENLDRDVANFVKLTLQMMASRNLHDHVNNGFFRYTTDPDWQTPHYEKMLYDNAQLARLYLEAHRLWPDQGYAAIAMRTLDFVETSLKHSDGGYMSSLSAVDHANKEGGAYLWTRAQLASLLTEDEMDYLAQQGQFESSNSEFLIKTLDGPPTDSEIADKAVILDKLRRHRSGGMPADTKRLAAWNAMLLDALVVAADFDARFAQRARALYRNMRDNFYSNGQLIRFAGNADVAAAALEDYAQVAHAFYNFGRRFDQRAAADDARRLVESAHSLFLKNDRWHQKARSLIPIAPGKWIMPDLVAFSPMTLWLSVAVEVPGLDPEIRESAARMLQRASREMLDSPYFYGSYIVLRIAQSG